MSRELWELGSGSLPEPPRPRGDYQPVVVHRGIAHTAGMTPRHDGVLTVTGRVGAEVDVDSARRAAALATANALAAVAGAAGGLAGVDRVLSMTVWIAVTQDFTEHSTVADGGTAALAELLGGPAPARAAVGVASLPGGAPVEVALVAALHDGHAPSTPRTP